MVLEIFSFIGMGATLCGIIAGVACVVTWISNVNTVMDRVFEHTTTTSHTWTHPISPTSYIRISGTELIIEDDFKHTLDYHTENIIELGVQITSLKKDLKKLLAKRRKA